MPVYEEKEKINGQKRWYIRTYILDQNGIKKQTTRHNIDWVGRDGYWLAQQEENRLKNKKIEVINNITLKELVKVFLEYKKPMIKFSSYLKYEDDFNNYILPYFENKKIFDITTNDVMLWQNQINKLDLSIYTKKRCYTTFSTLLKHGCIFYNLPKNVISMVSNFKDVKGVLKTRMNFLTKNEFESFITYEKSDLYREFFTILFYTGMRRGELLALTNHDIDLEKNIISIDKTYTPRYEKYNVFETVPKTSKSNRKIEMLDKVKAIAKEMLSNENSKLFENIKLTTLKRKCNDNCKKAGIKKNIRIHDFRHSFASMCIDNDVPISVISEYLGHENITTTLNTYSHLYPNSQAKLLNKLNKQD